MLLPIPPTQHLWGGRAAPVCSAGPEQSVAVLGMGKGCSLHGVLLLLGSFCGEEKMGTALRRGFAGALCVGKWQWSYTGFELR